MPSIGWICFGSESSKYQNKKSPEANSRTFLLNILIAFASRLPTVSTAAAVASATAATTVATATAAAVTATAATASAAAAVTATAATASAAAAVASAATTAAAAEAATTTATAATTGFTWFCFFHNDGTTINFAVVQLRNCFLSFFVVWHFHEGIAL